MNNQNLNCGTELVWRNRDGSETRAPFAARTSPGVFACPPGPPSSKWLEVRVPLRSINGIWSPYGDWTVGKKLTWQGQKLGTPFFKTGMLACVDRGLRSHFAFAPASSTTEIKVSWQIHQAWGCYLFQIEWPEDEPKELVFSREIEPVHEAVFRLNREILQGPETASRPEYYEPSYCTWYAFHADLEQKKVEDCARMASELGFGSFILDDGWQYDAPQRISGKLDKWHRFQGGYEPSKRKFPQFAEFFDLLGSYGLRKLLWVAPFLIGEDSEANKRFSGRLLPSWLDEGFLVADPRDEEFTAHLEDSLCQVVTDFNLDGFKVDYDYALVSPGSEFRGLGRAYCAAVSRWIKAVRGIRPNFEWNFIPNAFSCSIGNAFRCMDVPYDPETNRLHMANFKSMVGSAALQYDPALWRADESLDVVYRHLLPSLFCVPSVGTHLLEIPQSHREAIQAALGFYRRHQPLLNGGHFDAAWHGGDFQSFHTHLGDEEIDLSFSGFPVALDARKTRVINGDASAGVCLNFGCSGSVVLEDLHGNTLHAAESVRPGLKTVTCPNAAVICFQPD
jgi:alpha-galactosidase